MFKAIKTLLFGRMPIVEENQTIEVEESKALADGVLAVIAEEELEEFKIDDHKRLAIKQMLSNLVEKQAEHIEEHRTLWARIQKKYGIKEGHSLTLDYKTREISITK